MAFPPNPQQRALEEVLTGAADRLDSGHLDEALKVLHSRGGFALENPVGRNILGEIYLQQGKAGEALKAFDAALKMEPSFAEAHANRGAALIDLGRLMDALESERKALRLKPKLPLAHFNQGIVLAALKRPVEAVDAFSAALRERPEYVEAWINRGMARLDAKQSLEALADLRRALALSPDSPGVRLGLAEAYLAVGQRQNALSSADEGLAMAPGDPKAIAAKAAVLIAMQRHAAALPLVDELIAHQPDDPKAHQLRFTVMRQLRRFDEALVEADAVVRLAPNGPEGYALRAGVLSDLNRIDDSLAAMTLAERKGATGDFFQNVRGILMADIGDLGQARDAFGRAVALQPENPTYRYNRSMFLLAMGEMEEGLREHEWRLKDPDRPAVDRLSDAPQWNGEDLAGKRVLVLREQGNGDTIQFARFIPELQRRGAAVTLSVMRPLLTLLQRSLPGLDVAETLGFRAAYDYQVPIMSLAHALGATLASLPGPVPYMKADPARIEKWRSRVGNDGFKVGVVWQGNPQYFRDPYRSVPLRYFAPIAALPGVRLISLQAVNGLDQLKTLPAGMRVETFGDEIERNPDGFEEVAALMECLDLIVSSDTVSVHLAGALARPTFLALRHRPDWRWMQDRTDLPWYPTMRLFRQASHGAWDAVFAEIAGAVAERAMARTSGAG